jgi:hypothetical protein
MARWDEEMTTDPFPVDPILKTITVRLHADAALQDIDERQEIVVCALAAALAIVSDDLSLAWTVQAVPGDPLLYHVTPLPGPPVSVAAAWEMTHALREQPQLAAAEPLFLAAQDDTLREIAFHAPEAADPSATPAPPNLNGAPL